MERIALGREANTKYEKLGKETEWRCCECNCKTV